MVVVEVIRASGGEVTEFQAQGHAGYDDRGQDIVCAAVSALTQATANGLICHAKVDPEIHVNDDTGFLHCRIDPEKLRGEAGLKAQAILETMVTGLIEMAKIYSDHIEVKEVVRS